jgi:hypothetical protein
MRPSHASKKGRRYRYYVSAALIDTGVARGARGWRIPAAELEPAIAHAVAAKLRDPEVQVQLLGSGTAGAEPAATVIASLVRLAELLEAPASPAGRDALRRLIAGLEFGEHQLRAEVSFAQLDEAHGGGFADLAALELPVFSWRASIARTGCCRGGSSSCCPPMPAVPPTPRRSPPASTSRCGASSAISTRRARRSSP